MKNLIKSLKFMAIATSVIMFTFNFASCKKDDPATPEEPTPVVTQRLTEHITQDMTLVDLGLPIDYIVEARSGGFLEIKDGATLTIEPGVCIQFSRSKDGFNVCYGGTIKMLGSADKHIRLIGSNDNPGCWAGIIVSTKSTESNEFQYVDFVNAGQDNTNEKGALNMKEGSVKMNNCSIEGSLKYGIHATCSVTGGGFVEFSSNVIKNCDCPIHAWQIQSICPAIDITSDLTQNTNQYINVVFCDVDSNPLTINEASVPYYLSMGAEVGNVLTVNQGVTFYMGAGKNILVGQYNTSPEMRILANGTAEKPILITRFHGTAGLETWKGIYMKSPGNEFSYCTVEYGGESEINDKGCMTVGVRGSVSLKNVMLRNSGHYGFHWSDSECGVAVNGPVTFENNVEGNVWYGGAVYPDFESIP